MIVTETISKVVGAIASIDSAQLIKRSLVLAFAALLAGAIGYCLGCAPLLYVAGAVPVALIMGNGLIFLIKRYALPEDLRELLGTLEKIRHSQADQSEIDLSKLELYRAKLPKRYDEIIGRLMPAGSAFRFVAQDLQEDVNALVTKSLKLQSSNHDDRYEQISKDLNRNFVVRVKLAETEALLLSNPSDLLVFSSDQAVLSKLKNPVGGHKDCYIREAKSLIGNHIKPLECAQKLATVQAYLQENVVTQYPDLKKWLEGRWHAFAARLQDGCRSIGRLGVIKAQVEGRGISWDLIEQVLADTNQGLFVVPGLFATYWANLNAAKGRSASYDDKSIECQILDLAIEQNQVRRSARYTIQYEGAMLSVDQARMLDISVEPLQERMASLSMQIINPYFYGWTESVHQLAEYGLLNKLEDTDKQALREASQHQQSVNKAYDDLFTNGLTRGDLKQLLKLEGCCETDLQRALYWRALEAVSPETMHRVKNFVKAIELFCHEKVDIDALLIKAIPGSEWDIIRAQCKLSFIEGKSRIDQVVDRLRHGRELRCESGAVRNYLQALLEHYRRFNKYKQRCDSIQRAIETWDQV